MNVLAMSKETAAKATVDVETSCGVDPALDEEASFLMSKTNKAREVSPTMLKLKTSVPL